MGGLDRRAVATLSVATAMLAMAAALTWLHITGPSDGARLQPGQRVWRPDGVVLTPLRDQPEGLQPGDVVVAAGGRTLESWAQALLSVNTPRPRWTHGQQVVYTIVRDGGQMNIRVTLGRYPLTAVLRREWGAILFAAVLTILSAFVFFRRSTLPAAQALFLSASGIGSATTWSYGLQLSDIIGGVGFWLYLATTFGAYMILYAGALHLALVFPQPRPIVARHPWIIPAVYALPFAVHAVYVPLARRGAVSTLDWIGRSNADTVFLNLLYLGLIVVAATVGYRAARDPVSRRQIRWVAFATVLVGSIGLAFAVLPEIVFGHPLVSWNLIALLGLLIHIAFATAILQHRLFDIDVIINRAMVYGGLTASVVGIYVLVVGYLGKVFQARGSLAISLVAAGLVAIIFQPLRERLQRAVNRWMFGERDDPYAVISRLGRRLEATVAPDTVLPAIVETIAQALKLPYAAIALQQSSDLLTAASYGLARGEPVTLPLIYQGEPVGRLVLSPRTPNESFSPAEMRLLEDIAHQAGVAARAVRLTADLQRSRERLVATREEERRRLRRDLHDGLGPTLAGIALKLEAARNLLTRDPAAADAVLRDLKSETQTAIGEIRRLVYDLRPPALDELGLISALREQLTTYQANGLQISLEAPGQLPPLPAAVEVAAYRIVQEALTNVVRHASARSCRITIKVDEALEIAVVDDGIGLPSEVRAGVGLTSMRERAAELGGTFTIERQPAGGTRLLARLPLPTRESSPQP